MTTEQAPRRIEPRAFADAPPLVSPAEPGTGGGPVAWPVLVFPADPGVAQAATPGSGVAEAALGHETAFLDRKRRQLDLSPHLAPDVPEARVAGIVSWSDLTDEVLLTILANTGLMKGLRVEPERLVLEPAARTALTVEAKVLRECVNLCREDYFTHRACDGEVETALATSSVVKGSASASYAFASAKVAASQREQATRREGRRSVTAVGRQLSRRAVVFLGRDRVRPTPEFVEAVTAALARPDVVAQTQALSEVFEVFGLIWAQEVSLGSARTVATDVEVSDAATSLEVERHISAAVNVKFGGASGRATAEAGQDTSADSHVRDEVAEASSTTQGDVESPLHWAVIARDRLAPVYEVLPQDLRDRVLEVLFRARPELVAPVFAGPRMVPGDQRDPIPSPGNPAFTERAPTELDAVAAALRTHTPVTADALLVVSCDGTTPEAGWSQIDVEVNDGPRGPLASARLAADEALVDTDGDGGARMTTAIEALLASQGRPVSEGGIPTDGRRVASHSVLIPVRWPDAYVLRQRRGTTAAGPGIATHDIQVIEFRGGHRSHFDAWSELLPWDPTGDLAAACPAGSSISEDLRDADRVLMARIAWTPGQSGLLTMTASDPDLDRTPPADHVATEVTIAQGALVASLLADPRLPAPLSMSVPVVKSTPLTMTIAVTAYRGGAHPTPVRRAAIPVRFWFLPMRDTMHMGLAEPIVVNDLYTAHSDGFVTIHDPAGTFGTVAVTLPQPRPDAIPDGVSPDGVPGTWFELPRVAATRIRGATVTAPVRQGESFRAVVSDETHEWVDDLRRLNDFRDAFVSSDPDRPRAVFVPLRLVIPS